MTRVLDGLGGPADLRRLDAADLVLLAAEIRDLLVHTVARTSGHLGPNLGAVELTIALHRVFDSPTEPILFDVGHQSYVHKILTGRAAQMPTLRQTGGLSGYPSRAESPHDWIENSHASTALSYADGLAKAFEVRGERRPVVAVVGDGALTGGMCWEALNNIAASDRPVIVVVNDNGRSYSPTVGGFAEHLAGLRLRPGYERVLGQVKGALERTPVVGQSIYDTLHGVKRGLKDMLQPQGMFEDLGLKYFGPVDGHDVAGLEQAFRLARRFDGPVVVHCVTRKGYGYAPAENDEADQMHQSGGFDPVTGLARATIGKSWTGVFGDELVRIADTRDDVVAITAAMCNPVGLTEFIRRFPKRSYDVGIAEQHALTSAAGLASGGLHPVVALYATFLNRAFDQLLMDVALHRLPVTVVLDRAGITGQDGPSHNGMWDLALLGMVPGIRIAAPRDEPTLRELLREAVEVSDGPTVLRYPKTPLGDDLPALRSVGVIDVLAEPADDAEVDVLLIAVGSVAADVLEAARGVGRAGYSVRVVAPRWVTPVDPAILDLARQAALVVTVEDGVEIGGVGSRVAQTLRAAGRDVPTREIGVPVRFLEHGSVADV
ncbi:MAG: 1-deoxy-D-xylulose-5-phosphate synthase, partial [Actinomycetota bacterium]|nr:1-deoxy-D-xylulose-5-phosphate synthase [Actinomycetota bacterium]